LSTAILDNPNEIKRIDKSGMLSFCVEASKHCQKAARLAWAVPINYSKPKTIIVAGMGGSVIGGELSKEWAMDKIDVPIEVCRDYSLPAYVDERTLVFVVSYSGETEEALSMFLDAIKRNCMVFCISSGGKLLEFAEKLKLPYLQVPSGIPQPRAALPYLFLPLPIFLEKLGLISDVSSEFSEAIKVLEQVEDENSPEKPLNDNFSKMLASKINGTVPVVYGFGVYRAVAQRYKQQFNENSKVPARWEFFPELNHNEIVGWEAAKELANCFSTIFIREKDEPEEIRQRIEATKELMSKKVEKSIFEVWSVGKSRLAKMLYAIYIGDFTSVYLAILRGVDPTPVKTITLLKERITQSGVKEKIIAALQKLCEK
jgi:glucose/mannose-6-phosphate isomerase